MNSEQNAECRLSLLEISMTNGNVPRDIHSVHSTHEPNSHIFRWCGPWEFKALISKMKVD